MFNRILTILQGDGEATEDSRFEKVQVATCALLLEVAHSDGHYQSVEAQVVHDLLANTFNLSASAVAELVDYSHQYPFHHLRFFSLRISVAPTGGHDSAGGAAVL